jgi:2-methylcitrate dehydratase PrpD
VPRRSLIVCEPRAEKRRPRAAIDAKFSLYFTVAHTLLHGAPGLASYGPASLGDPATLALAARVDYTVDTGPALLEVRLKDGSRRLWNIDGLYGSPENPMDEQALVAKFIDCALASPRRLPAAKAAPLAQQLLRIDGHADLQPLLRRL